ncbi:MAG: monofunctional biosynthetic peptidoglycan transglycosylase [bacterium]|nr:monofunctional biosynthetic peptidoglycan transglycosylase [bacterium]
MKFLPRRWWHWFWIIPMLIIEISVIWVLLLRFVPPVITPLMLIRWTEGRIAHKPVGISVKWKSIENISPCLIEAVIASEDQKFFHHNGFDWEAIDKAVKINERRKGRHMKGASTISMQTARNVFLWQERTWLRKGMEAYFTVLIESMWSKKRILEVYLNVIEWGPGIYGAESASQIFFDCNAKQLNLSESALMAAVLPNPRRWCPANPSPYILMRQENILRQIDYMGDLNLLYNLQ